jgi:hypothetical protein
MKTIRNIKMLILMILASQMGILNAQNVESFKQLAIPESGTWWNSSQSGTGTSMQFSKNGNWFMAMYLYAEDGSPIFLTMQGESIDYSFDRTEFSNNAYAKATSTVFTSVNGRCLGCEYTEPVTTPLEGVNGEILFIQKNKAIVKFSGAVNFEEELNSDLLPDDFFTNVANADVKTVQFMGNGINTNYLVRELRVATAGIPATVISSYECVNCEINLSGDQINFETLNFISTDDPEQANNSVVLKIDDEILITYNVITGKDGIYAIVDEDIAAENAIPTQIIVTTAFH